MALGGCGWAERWCGQEQQRACKIPGGWPGENSSRRSFAGCCGAKCTLHVTAAPGGGKARKQTAAGGWPLTLGCAGGAVGSVQGLSRRLDSGHLVL
jgi:hypothetical protein